MKRNTYKFVVEVDSNLVTDTTVITVLANGEDGVCEYYHFDEAFSKKKIARMFKHILGNVQMVIKHETV